MEFLRLKGDISLNTVAKLPAPCQLELVTPRGLIIAQPGEKEPQFHYQPPNLQNNIGNLDF